MNIQCIPCNVLSTCQSNFNKHKQTFKHKRNVIAYNKAKKSEENLSKVYNCCYCPAEFKTQAGMLKHQYKCKNDEIASLKQQMKDMEKDNEIKIIKIELEKTKEALEFSRRDKDVSDGIASK